MRSHDGWERRAEIDQVSIKVNTWMLGTNHAPQQWNKVLFFNFQLTTPFTILFLYLAGHVFVWTLRMYATLFVSSLLFPHFTSHFVLMRATCAIPLSENASTSLVDTWDPSFSNFPCSLLISCPYSIMHNC